MSLNSEQKLLRDEILLKRKDVTSDTLNFSVGELINLYKDGDLDLEPAFQRFFRWTKEQQTNFIESLILDYPIPAIFVFQKFDGIWEVIDGVQRISTLVNFMGATKEGESLKNPLILSTGSILKNLNNKCYDLNTLDFYKNSPEFLPKNKKIENISCLDLPTNRDLKRSRIPVIVLSNKSVENSKLELFKRLNSGGSSLNSQEIRNALIYMIDADKFSLIENTAKNSNFRELIRLDENGEKLSFDMEVVTRYLILKNEDIIEKYSSSENSDDYFDKSIEKILKEIDNDTLKNQLDYFMNISDFLSENLIADYGFRLYNSEKSIFKGPFSWFVFEIVIRAAIQNEEQIQNKSSEFIKNIKELKPRSIQGKKVLNRMFEISKEIAEEAF